ncbi:PLP-dependent aminotransferase family protein [uncultured Marinobacter sp.]|uniref:aminotransferase-like domain-containing protein n=1 Tax=uncultured Marinobacter sp. TaxID=187379 RepID=UPI00262AF542|nr:PLP-dependent aminotransferase family protein [uncultured Marinobacter sp.]
MSAKKLPIENLIDATAQRINRSRNRAEPLYEQLADTFTDWITGGNLGAGERLPTHRELASQLSINITTVTKAMAILQEAGLVESRPGRGTRVKLPVGQPQAQFLSAPSDVPGLIDLSINRPATNAYSDFLPKLLPQLAADPRFLFIQDYQIPEGPLWARSAAQTWLGEQGIDTTSGQIIITEGAQHGIACTLRALTQPGDTILTDSVTYQGINALCHTLGLNIIGVNADTGGMCPKALEAACTEHQPEAIFLVPSIQNPTTVTLSEHRRRELAAIIKRFGLLLIEDDVYRPLLDTSPPPFAELLPDQTVYITAMSKCIAPGLRMGFVVPPLKWQADISATLRIDCWSTSPLSTLIASRLIEGGQASEMVALQREELRARQSILQELFVNLNVQSSATSPHAWLHLPDAWRASSFAKACYENGVSLLPGVAFTLRRESPPDAVRINLAAARNRDQLVVGLSAIARLAQQGHLHMYDAV